jgi:inner membrane protein
MTGRTHDLAALTALNAVISLTAIPQFNIATGIAALGSNMIGGLLPDLDNVTSDIWDKIRFGNLLARLIKPLIGGHRMISHSLLGLGIVAFLSEKILNTLGGIILVDMKIVWAALIIGYLSHLLADTLTTEGVPWLFPIPYRFGFPPEKQFRIKTGGWGEKLIFFPGLILLNGYLIYRNYPAYLELIQSLK